MELWNNTIYSEELLGLERPCPDCDGTVYSTGRMFYSEYLDQWYVEFVNPRDGELFPIFTYDLHRMAERIADKLMRGDQ